MKIFLCLLVLASSCNASYMGGIPVPGISVPILRLFENYAASCKPNSKKDFGMDQLAEIMRSFEAEELVQKIYNSLFSSMGNIEITKLMGKWYTAVDSRNVHKEDCAMYNFELISQAEYTVTFNTLKYAIKNGQIEMNQGFGRVTGVDPGGVLITTGDPVDTCPFFPVKLGGLNRQGEYEYMILSQPLKHPSMVLTRDLSKFNAKYSKEVYQFLEKSGFMSPLAAFNTRLHFTNTTECSRQNRYYASTNFS